MRNEKFIKAGKYQGLSLFSLSVMIRGKSPVLKPQARKAKLLLSIFVLLLSVMYIQAQFDAAIIDSLKLLISSGKDDTLKVQRLHLVSLSAIFSNPDSALIYSERTLLLSQSLGYKAGVASALYSMGAAKNQLGDFAGSLSLGFKGLKLCQELNDSSGIILSTQAIGTRYRDYGDYKQALIYLLNAKKMTEALPENAVSHTSIIPFPIPKKQVLVFQNGEIGFSYLSINPDSAIFHAKQSYQSSQSIYNGGWIYSIIVLGNAYSALNQFDSSLHYFNEALKQISGNPTTATNDIADTYIGLATLYKKQQAYDSCVFYAQKGLSISKRIAYQKGIYNVSSLLADVYEDKNPEEAVKYFRLSKDTRDSLYSKEKEQQIQNIALNEELKQQELQQKLSQAEFEYKSQLKIYMLLAGLILLVIIVGGLWRKNIFKQKSYAFLQKQKEEIDFQKGIAENAFTNLKAAQAQLIQSEKMASLGELTAGIAHEIQNPLNFVNNFSEVNSELIDEADKEIDNGNISEVKTILNDIKENEQKINHHGKRADAIVKGMLQHSQASSGKKEPTDINALADEYLRLAYNNFKSKVNDLTEIKLITEWDNSLPLVNVIPQEIGRVLLNLFNNAFWAVNERQKNLVGLTGTNEKNLRGLSDGNSTNFAGSNDAQAIANLQSYQPLVILTTKNLTDHIEIRIHDNGPGIPPHIIDKIFQPFFTTKPTGQGTGLGLSLAYDIIKAHQGELRVETVEARPPARLSHSGGDDPVGRGEGTEFIIHLLIMH